MIKGELSEEDSQHKKKVVEIESNRFTWRCSTSITLASYNQLNFTQGSSSSWGQW